MANKIWFTFFHKRVHPFLIILAVVHRAAHALNTLELIGIHGVRFTQHAQFFFDDGDSQRRFFRDVSNGRGDAGAV